MRDCRRKFGKRMPFRDFHRCKLIPNRRNFIQFFRKQISLLIFEDITIELTSESIREKLRILYKFVLSEKFYYESIRNK